MFRSEEYRMGYYAYVEGVPSSNNPFYSEDADYEEWEAGWQNAAEDD